MKKTNIFTAVIGIVSLTACGSKTDANEKNFGAAMSQYFEKKGELCLNITKWPVDVSEMDERLAKSFQTGTSSRMSALRDVGLVKEEVVDVDIIGMMGKPTGAKVKVKRYSLTEAAKPFIQTKEVSSVGLNGKTAVPQSDFCWGKKALEKIIKWEGPMKFGDYQEANITYTYKINNVAPWATKPSIQMAFPAIKSVLDGASKNQLKHGVKLTSEGWEARGLDPVY